MSLPAAGVNRPREYFDLGDEQFSEDDVLGGEGHQLYQIADGPQHRH